MKDQPAPYSSSAPWGIFPPWGFMNVGDLPTILGKPGHPKSWRENEASYERWFMDTLKLIQGLLWPVFDFPTKSWQGASVSTMEALTRADLDLLRTVYSSYPQILDQPIHATQGIGARKTHHDLFSEEDLFIHDWGTSFAHYDSTWTSAEIANLMAIIVNANSSKIGSSMLRFKYHLMRPRPYQMALILNYDDFSYFEALSADTPSMCTGHCIQALLTVGAVMERLILGKQEFKPERWAALEQFAVDIGDRRVMARVHYPSDNLCSWLIVLRMANHVFGTPEVKKHLWHAIRHHSFVYDLITSSAKDKSLYAPALQELAAESGR